MNIGTFEVVPFGALFRSRGALYCRLVKPVVLEGNGGGVRNARHVLEGRLAFFRESCPVERVTQPEPVREPIGMRLKRFVLFGGEGSGEGGLADALGTCDDEVKADAWARARFEKGVSAPDCDWVQVLDRETGEVLEYTEEGVRDQSVMPVGDLDEWVDHRQRRFSSSSGKQQG